MASNPSGPPCVNNPNHQLTPGDRQAVADFKAYLQQRADGRGDVVRRRKKPVEVHTMQWTGDNEQAVQAFTGGPSTFYALDPADRENSDDPEATATVYDKLHSTWILVYTGQHIVRGVKGEFYPIAEDVLAETYERADAAPAAVEPPADPTAAPVCICGHPEERHFEDVCQTCGCGDYLEPRGAAEVIARWRQAALKAPTDPVQHAPGKAVRCPDCRAKGYTVCLDEPAAEVWRGATEVISDSEVERLAATGLVYRQGRGRLLHCLHHKPVPASRWADFHEVTADDLPDGGICVHPRCGADLLAVQAAAGIRQDGAQP